MYTYELSRRLDTTNASAVEKELTAIVNTENPDVLVCDFSNTEYVSSAGLRVMLLFTKLMKSKGHSFVLVKMNADINNIFEMAGFHRILDIRQSI